MRFKNTPYRIVPLARCILAKLYIEHVNDTEEESYIVGDIRNLFSVPLSKNLIRSSLEWLRGNTYQGNQLIRRLGNQKSGYSYNITPEGLREVELSLRDKSSDISYFVENGDDSLDAIAGPNAIYWSKDEYREISHWKPIDLDPDDEDFKSVLRETEATLEEINKSNEFEAKFPEEKSGILSSIKIGLEALKSLRPTKAQLNDLLIRPLKWVATTFANSFLGQVAKNAAQKIIDFFSAIIF